MKITNLYKTWRAYEPKRKKLCILRTNTSYNKPDRYVLQRLPTRNNYSAIEKGKYAWQGQKGWIATGNLLIDLLQKEAAVICSFIGLFSQLYLVDTTGSINNHKLKKMQMLWENTKTTESTNTEKTIRLEPHMWHLSCWPWKL